MIFGNCIFPYLISYQHSHHILTEQLICNALLILIFYLFIYLFLYLTIWFVETYISKFSTRPAAPVKLNHNITAYVM